MSKPQWVDKEIQSFSSQLVCICYYIFEKQTQPRGVCFYDTMQPLGEKNQKQWHCQNGRTRRSRGRAEAADMRCDAPCRSPWEKGAPQNATMWVFVLMPAMQERRAELAASKMRGPFESGTIPVWGTALVKESSLHQSGFLGGTLIYSTHAHIHSSGMPSL